MATLTNKFVNGEVVSTTSAYSNAYTNIDDHPTSADGAFCYEYTNSTTTRYGRWALENMPSDFDSMSTLSFTLRHRVAGAQTNYRGVRVRIATDEATPVGLTAWYSLYTATALGAFTNTSFTNDGGSFGSLTGTKAQWDNAILEVELDIVKNKGGDTNGHEIDAFVMSGTYVLASTDRTITSAPLTIGTLGLSASMTNTPPARTISSAPLQIGTLELVASMLGSTPWETDSEYTNEGTGTTVSVPKGSAGVDDYVVAYLIAESSSNTLTPHADFTTVREASAGDFRHCGAYRRVQAGDPTSWNFSISASDNWTLVVAYVSGASATLVDTDYLEQTTAADYTIETSLVATAAGQLALAFAAGDFSGAAAWSVAEGGWVEQVDYQSATNDTIGLYTLETTGSGTVTATMTTDYTGGAQQLSSFGILFAPAGDSNTISSAALVIGTLVLSSAMTNTPPARTITSAPLEINALELLASIANTPPSRTVTDAALTIGTLEIAASMANLITTAFTGALDIGTLEAAASLANVPPARVLDAALVLGTLEIAASLANVPPARTITSAPLEIAALELSASLTNGGATGRSLTAALTLGTLELVASLTNTPPANVISTAALTVGTLELAAALTNGGATSRSLTAALEIGSLELIASMTNTPPARDVSSALELGVIEALASLTNTPPARTLQGALEIAGLEIVADLSVVVPARAFDGVMSIGTLELSGALWSVQVIATEGLTGRQRVLGLVSSSRDLSLNAADRTKTLNARDRDLSLAALKRILGLSS